MPTPTYTPIASYTVASGQDTTSFQSIPTTYQDLILVMSGQYWASSPSGTTQPQLRFNNDSSGNAHNTSGMEADGTTSGIYSNNYNNVNTILSAYNWGILTFDLTATTVFHIFDYNSTGKHKSVLAWGGQKINGGTQFIVGRWANTNAITRIDLFASLSAGSTIALYGVGA